MSWHNGIKIERITPQTDGYKFAKNKVQSTISHEDIFCFNIKSIYRIKNKYTWERYQDMRDDICDDLDGYYVKEMHLFHGTPYAREIAVEGFDQGLAKAKGMFGKGVYFAEHSSKSNNYAFGAFKGCPKHNNKKCEICIRRILICKVALGRIYRTKRTVKYLPEGYHSVKAIPDTGFLLRPEYIIYNDEQVYPSFLIQYTATYKKKPPKVSPYPLYRSLAPPIPTPTVYDITQACSSLSLTQTAVAEDAMWITYLQTMSNLSASAQSYYLYFFD